MPPPEKPAMALADCLYRTALLWRGRGCWHWRHYGRHYRAEVRAGGWDVTIERRRYRLRSLSHWLPSGRNVHIVLSGPSISRIDAPDLLLQGARITVNGSFQILADGGVHSDLYLISDVGYVRRQWSSVQAGIANARALAVDHRVALELARRDPDLFDRIPTYLFDNLQRPYRQSSAWWRRFSPAELAMDGQRCAFSNDADIGFYPSRTVAFLALQIAAAQRPRRIVLFGLDLSEGRYYAEATPERSMLQQDYAEYIAPDFRFAADLLRNTSIEVINASLQSTLPGDILPRVDPNEYLKQLPFADAA
ncbi:hypothetical protein [Solimonas marina]|uniref:Lipopolysaccharide core biosynthesis protein n=1 Tax=Solimonas marina TaxID=2714601 RepID=A0A969W8X0_9GAMM|nr:hypothetical protein [Solimonas marina]NKF21648.1 hypothetical protein [Solimonas marina]